MTESRIPSNIDEILEAARRAGAFVDGMTQREFLDDAKTQQAVTMSIMIIGEAATRLIKEAPDFVARHESLPWHRMRNMRNRIAHGYFTIDLEAVWDTVQSSMPELVRQLLAIRAAEGV